MTGDLCQVCGGIARRFHYSAWVCASCASFFRRTIIFRKGYICLKTFCKDSANVSPCKDCRMKRCVEVGMKIESVLLRKSPTLQDQFKECDFVQKIINARDAIYIHKMSALTKMANKRNQKLEMGILNARKERMELSRVSEFYCMLTYLQDSGICDLLNRSELIFLASKLFYKWLYYSETISTLRHDGHQKGVVYLTDCTFVPYSFDGCYDFVQKQELKNTNELANFYFECFQHGMQLISHFVELDSTEWAFLLNLMVVNQAKELFPDNKAIKEQINNLLRELKTYIGQNYTEMELRFANLLLLLYEINTIDVEFHMLSQLLCISGYTSVVPKLIESYKRENKLPDF